jgi:hypothetical protein
VSKYTVAPFKPHMDKTNEADIKNELNREFNQQEHLSVVVGDSTYARVEKKWHYICLLVFTNFTRSIHKWGSYSDGWRIYEYK